MRIIVVGAGKVGTSLTAQLIREHRVTVIDQEPKLIENIINVYDVMGVCGNGASYEVQKEAEVGKADLLIATTSSDEINILACLVAKSWAWPTPSPASVTRSTKRSFASCGASWASPCPSIRKRQRPTRSLVCCGSRRP